MAHREMLQPVRVLLRKMKTNVPTVYLTVVAGPVFDDMKLCDHWKYHWYLLLLLLLLLML